MGCLKLTYDYQEQGEKNDSLKWRVWVNPESDFLGVVDQQTQGGSPQILYAGMGGSMNNNNPSIADLVNQGLGVIGIVLNTAEAYLQVEKIMVQAGKYSRAAYNNIKIIDKSIAGIKSFGKNLGYVGIGLNLAVVANSYINGNGITKSQLFDLGVGVVLGALTVTNPVFLIGFGVYGLLDSQGVFKDLKQSLGGNDIVLRRDH